MQGKPTMEPMTPQRPLPARRPLAILLAACACLLAGACADLSGISPKARQAEPAAVGLAVAPAAFDWPDAQWWRPYGDDRLAALVERALAGNPSLMAAESRLARARSLVDLAESESGPGVGGRVDVTRQRFTETGMIPPALAGRTRTTYSASLVLGWELDFFGRHRAALQAALGTVQAAEAELQAARVLLASRVVAGWIELARLLEQRRLARETLAQDARMLDLVRSRTEAGLDSRVELRRAEGELPRTRAGIEALDGEIALVRHALAVLSAQPPQALNTLEASLPPAPRAALPAEIPADLLGRRADVAAARWRIEAAIGARDETRARFYPNVNLAGFLGLSTLSLTQWLDAGSRTWGVGPAVRLPLFDTGALRAELRDRTAGLDEAVHAYNGAIADAAREVADRLASLQALARRDREQRLALEAAQDAHDLAVQRYRAGLGTYLDVISAQAAVTAERRLAADLDARAAELHAGLAHALGGGYLAPDARTDGSTR
jgi:NodT family efflux transporter outer membrane factor (OMF) lipoprotein